MLAVSVMGDSIAIDVNPGEMMRRKAMMMAGMMVGVMGCVPPDGPDERERAETSPEQQPEVTPDTPEQVDASAPITVYARDASGFPVPHHAGSFRQVIRHERRACLLDEFSQLFCVDVPPYEEAVKTQDIEPIAQDVELFALTHETVCVSRGARVLCRNGREVWQEVTVMDAQIARLSGADSFPSSICATDTEGAQRCFWLSPAIEGEAFSRPAQMFDTFLRELEGFDVRNVRSGRLEEACGVNSSGGMTCLQSTGDMTYARVDQPHDGAPYIDVRSGSDGAAALSSDGKVKVWALNFDTLEFVEELDGEFEALASESCGIRRDGTVTCWAIQTGCRGGASGLQEWTPTDSPQHFSAWRTQWCAVMEDGHMTCAAVDP